MSDQTAYDLFISYARKNDRPIPGTHPPGWVTAIHDHILKDHRQYSTAPLRIFFDQEEIQDGDKWWRRIIGALRQSRMLLVCLSPDYYSSHYCRREWEEYTRLQVHKLIGSEGILPIYFIEVPDNPEHATPAWLHDTLRSDKSSNYTDLRPWYPEGATALHREDVRQRLARLGGTLYERIQRAHRAAAVPGNLRRQNPHFVGRQEELRRLHEQLGLGAVGVVTAVHGLGGQGKTELAVAYAHGWADCYPAGLWSLPAEGRHELLPLLGDLAWERALGYTPTEADRADPARLGLSVLAHLQARAAALQAQDPDRCAATLILLDNVSEPALLSPAQLATLPGGLAAGWLRLLATTRLDLPAQKDSLALLAEDALDEDAALTLIRDHQPYRDAQKRPVADPAQSDPPHVTSFASPAEEEAARELVRDLGGFTLAVEQVGVYLGIHHEVPPTSLLATLRSKGFAPVFTLGGRQEIYEATERDGSRKALNDTRDKQLALILEATLARLDPPALTALAFAALLPPDAIPWPWLRALTLAQHPELAKADDLGADPWLTLQRRLTGLRLLTPGDDPEVARMHRLVGAYLPTHVPQMGRSQLPAAPSGSSSSDSSNRIVSVPDNPGASAHTPAPAPLPSLASTLEAYLVERAFSISSSEAAPEDWELDALPLAAQHRFAVFPGHTIATHLLPFIHPRQALAMQCVLLTEKLRTYRTLPVATQLHSAAHRVLERLATDAPDQPGWQQAFAVSLNTLGKLSVSQGNLAAALQSQREALAINDRLMAHDATQTEWQFSRSTILLDLGDLAMSKGERNEAPRAYMEARLILERYSVSHPDEPFWLKAIFATAIRQGDLTVAKGDSKGARRLYMEAKTVAERLVGLFPHDLVSQSNLCIALERSGDIAREQGEHALAVADFERSREIRAGLVAKEPANLDWQRALAIPLSRLGSLFLIQGDLAAARRHLTGSHAIVERIATADPAHFVLQGMLAVSFTELGDLEALQGDLVAAAQRFHESFAITQRLASFDRVNAKWTRALHVLHLQLGKLSAIQGNLAGAKVHFEEAYAISTKLVAGDPGNALWQGDLAAACEQMALLTHDAGDPAGSMTWWQQCHAVLEDMTHRGMRLESRIATLRETVAKIFQNRRLKPLASPQPREAAPPPPPPSAPVPGTFDHAAALQQQGDLPAAVAAWADLLHQGVSPPRIIPRLAECLLKMDDSPAPATRQRLEAILRKLDDDGWFAEARTLRTALNSRTPKPRRRWWPWGT